MALLPDALTDRALAWRFDCGVPSEAHDAAARAYLDSRRLSDSGGSVAPIAV